MDGLSGSDFVADGSSPGSGAIRFPEKDFNAVGTVQVPIIDYSWVPLEGIYCEIICKFDAPPDLLLVGGTLLRSELFTFGVGRYKFESLPPYLGASVEFQPLPDDPTYSIRIPESQGTGIPAGEWATLGFLYDGLSTTQILINGVVATETVTFGLPQMGTPQLLKIGPVHGLIDDVKIWRLSPQRITDNFLDRPLDSATARCLAEWLAQTQQVLAADPTCAEKFSGLLDKALRSGLVDVLAGDDTRQIWQRAMTDYRQAWSEGRFDDVAAIIAKLSQMPSIIGPFENEDATIELRKDPCVQQILAALPPLTCDPELSSLAESIAAITPFPAAADKPNVRGPWPPGGAWRSTRS